ncbi:MAG: 4'-phosphopantetheinyl transferase superfamily protein [Acidobacteriota bacterium]
MSDAPILSEFPSQSRVDATPETREVHLWSVDLHPDAKAVAAFRKLLTSQEIERAERFKFDRHRRRFIVRRGALRRLMGAYLEQDPAAVRFEEGEKGKPFVPQPEAPPAQMLHFNLTDSKDLAVYAITRGAELGVDVEILRPMPDALSIAEHFFAADEREDLRGVPETERSAAFFNCWTRKEAYIKAIGEGLSEPLDRFCVTLKPEQPARFIHLGGDSRRARDWSLYHMLPEPGAVGALALEGPGWRVTRCYRYAFQD